MATGKSLNITVSEELYKKIKKGADEKEISMAAFIRIACAAYLKQLEENEKRSSFTLNS
jgi:predicted DNA-binding ribbon-helix-helix protein